MRALEVGELWVSREGPTAARARELGIPVVYRHPSVVHPPLDYVAEDPNDSSLVLELAGFESVERIDRQAFEESTRLPQIPTAELSGKQLWIANQINLLRDHLDDLLYGFQDYGMVGRKPAVGDGA